jgi:hypothetical protein
MAVIERPYFCPRAIAFSFTGRRLVHFITIFTINKMRNYKESDHLRKIKGALPQPIQRSYTQGSLSRNQA